MNYQECLRATYFDLESWAIALVGLIVSFLLLRFGKIFFATICIAVGLLLAASWAYLHYELNCLELKGLSKFGLEADIYTILANWSGPILPPSFAMIGPAR